MMKTIIDWFLDDGGGIFSVLFGNELKYKFLGISFGHFLLSILITIYCFVYVHWVLVFLSLFAGIMCGILFYKKFNKIIQEELDKSRIYIIKKQHIFKNVIPLILFIISFIALYEINKFSAYLIFNTFTISTFIISLRNFFWIDRFERVHGVVYTNLIF